VPENVVVIDCFPQSVHKWEGFAVVAIDVVRATTTAITTVAMGRRCFPVATTDQAFDMAANLDDPLLVGEMGGVMPEGFEITNSPAAVAARSDIHRPAILLSSSGTRLCQAAAKHEHVFLASLRNYTALAGHLAAQGFSKIAVIGAGTHNEFREEDQMCCAWIAKLLIFNGYSPGTQDTSAIADAWCNSSADAWVEGKSAAYLRRTNQLHDLDFILGHVDDLDAVFRLQNGEVRMERAVVFGGMANV